MFIKLEKNSYVRMIYCQADWQRGTIFLLLIFSMSQSNNLCLSQIYFRYLNFSPKAYLASCPIVTLA